MIFRQLREQFISSIPLTTNLTPAVKELKPFWRRLPHYYEIEKWETGNCYNRVGMICSEFTKVRCIDIDDKNDPEGKISQDFLSILEERHPEIYSKLYIERTKSNGHHLIFKANLSEETKTYKKFFAYAKTEDGKKNLIDVFFDKHFVVVAPTENYEPIHGSIFDIQWLQDHEVMKLLKIINELSRHEKHLTKKTNVLFEDQEDTNSSIIEEERIEKKKNMIQL